MQSIMTIQIPHPPTCDAIHTHTRQSLNHLKKKKEHLPLSNNTIAPHHHPSLLGEFGNIFLQINRGTKKKKICFSSRREKEARAHPHTQPYCRIEKVGKQS